VNTLSSVEKGKRWQIPLGLFLLSLLIGGWFYYPLGYFLIVCMIGAMGIGLVKGRNWCDWMCPRGSAWDVFLSRFSRKVKVPPFFRHVAFRIFWLAVLMTVLGTQLYRTWGDYYLMGRPFVMILTVTTIIGLIFGIIYHHRIWCMFCPMGTMANWLGKGKKPLKIDNEKCIDCQSCYSVCRMQINPGQYREEGIVKHGDCLKCSYCIEKCPKHALSFGEVERQKAA